MTNIIQSITVIMIVTNAPTTNWITPSGKDIEVGRSICHECVTHFNLNGVPTRVTNCFTNSLLLEKFVLREEWVPGPIPDIQSIHTNIQSHSFDQPAPVPFVVCYTNYGLLNREWIPVTMPNIKRPPPLPQHR